MFYYCEKCAQIENIKNPGGSKDCPVCNTRLKEVPQEFLMSNGSFFKSQEDRERLLAQIKNGEQYDSELAESKESLLKEKARISKERIEQRNEELKAEQEAVFSLECPICHGKSVSKISNLGKAAKVYAFGLFGTGDLGKKYKCNICGAKF